VPTSDIPVLDRPFYFIVVLWGERFRDYFLDLCLPTLLSPGNLPALSARQRSRFLVCTRPEDWAAMQVSPIFRLLEKFVDPLFFEIPAPPPGTAACVHKGNWGPARVRDGYDARAYPFVLQPDTIFSDGMIARLQELASQGVELALVPTLRFAEEPLFDHLRQFGISPRGRKGIAEPIVLSSRQLVHMALASLHSETKTYEWDAPYFHATPSAAWWKVPGEDGIVVHCMSWHPCFSTLPPFPRMTPRHSTTGPSTATTFTGTWASSEFIWSWIRTKCSLRVGRRYPTSPTTMGQLGFFDADKRLQALSARGDPLEAIDHLVPWESFRAAIEAVVLTMTAGLPLNRMP
jgi:hypothetical protein